MTITSDEPSKQGSNRSRKKAYPSVEHAFKSTFDGSPRGTLFTLGSCKRGLGDCDRSIDRSMNVWMDGSDRRQNQTQRCNGSSQINGSIDAVFQPSRHSLPKRELFTLANSAQGGLAGAIERSIDKNNQEVENTNSRKHCNISSLVRSIHQTLAFSNHLLHSFPRGNSSPVKTEKTKRRRRDRSIDHAMWKPKERGNVAIFYPSHDHVLRPSPHSYPKRELSTLGNCQ